jgi:integrase
MSRSGGIGLHLFRHSYATAMLSRGMNPVALQTILGHESLEMISKTYSHLVISDTYEAMARAPRHPLTVTPV